MRFEITGDDSVFNHGIAKNLLISIDGKSMTIPVKTKIGELWEIVKKADLKPSNDKVVSTTIKEPNAQPSEDLKGENANVEASDNDIQREDLVKVINIMPRFQDQSKNELMDSGLTNGGIYRVFKVHQNMVTLPDKPDVLTKIINFYEVIDDNAAQPRLLTAFPQEVQLYKKRVKSHSGKGQGIVSEFLKCPECGESNALLLQDNCFVGLCKCGHENKIERQIVLCPNEKCVNEITKDRTKVSIFLYGNEFKGICGQCKQVVVKEGVKA